MELTDLNKDNIYDILNRLNDKDLYNFCQVNNFKNICKDDMFWKSRILAIFGSKTEEILKNKLDTQPYEEFYKTNNFYQYLKTHAWCLELLKLPKKSQMVIDDFYNPQTGFIKVFGSEDMKYLLLKIVLQRYQKEGLDDTKLIQLVKQAKNEIPEYHPFVNKFSDSLELTENEKKLIRPVVRLIAQPARGCVRRRRSYFRNTATARSMVNKLTKAVCMMGIPT